MMEHTATLREHGENTSNFSSPSRMSSKESSSHIGMFSLRFSPVKRYVDLNCGDLETRSPGSSSTQFPDLPFRFGNDAFFSISSRVEGRRCVVRKKNDLLSCLF